MAGSLNHRVGAFLVTYTTFMLFKGVQRTMSLSRALLVEEWTGQGGPGERGPAFPKGTWDRAPSLCRDRAGATRLLGGLDAVMLVASALGQYGGGWLADRLDLRLLLSGAALLYGLTLFGIAPGLRAVGLESAPAYFVLIFVFVWVVVERQAT